MMAFQFFKLGVEEKRISKRCAIFDQNKSLLIFFSVKDQIMSFDAFAGQVISVTTNQLFHLCCKARHRQYVNE